MKLLIVDDEELTREGLMEAIDWGSISITEVKTANDGINGLELAKTFQPEIILSDVRMPRMTGIDMALKIRSFLPNTSIIFMSGYSDKEYLKAAIKLKAVSYVDKPINTSEIIVSVSEAIDEYNSKTINDNTIIQNKNEILYQSALNLCYHNDTIETNALVSKLNDFGITLKGNYYVSTILYKASRVTGYDLNKVHDISKKINNLSVSQILGNIFTPKEAYIVFHIFTSSKPENNLLEAIVMTISQIADVSYNIAVGKPVSSIELSYNSYNYAVILMHSSFFFGSNSVLYYEPTDSTNNFLPSDLPDKFLETLINKDFDSAKKLSAYIFNLFKNNRIFLVNQAKDLYYQLFLSFDSAYKTLQINNENNNSTTVLDYITNCEYLDELNTLICNKLDELSSLLTVNQEENSTIYMIKDYISKNYHDYNLSIKSISDYVNLSSSYICTVFKSETGQTLNQYITDYRIQRAKKLLLDPRNKITDISSQVGYNNGNYFGKSFKKEVGLSPSEFREQNVK